MTPILFKPTSFMLFGSFKSNYLWYHAAFSGLIHLQCSFQQPKLQWGKDVEHVNEGKAHTRINEIVHAIYQSVLEHLLF